MYEKRPRSQVTRGESAERPYHNEPRRLVPGVQRKIGPHPALEKPQSGKAQAIPDNAVEPLVPMVERNKRPRPTVVPSSKPASHSVGPAQLPAAPPQLKASHAPSNRYTVERGVLSPAAMAASTKSQPHLGKVGNQPPLERSELTTQSFGDPTRDPAERQADAIGADIGAELKHTDTVPDGPIRSEIRAIAEKHVGVDLADANLRTDESANQRAADMGAIAVTEGSRVSFARGRLTTNTEAGRALIGHELTHVAQQKAHGFADRPAAMKLDADPAPRNQATSNLAPLATSGNEEPNPTIADETQHKELIAVANRIGEDAVAFNGELTKLEFLARLRRELEQMVDDELHGTPFTGKNCPWIIHYIALYQGLPVEHLRQVIARFVPGLAPGAGVDDLLSAAVGRAREGVKHWRDSGEQPAAPPTMHPGQRPPPLDAPVVQRKAADSSPAPTDDPMSTLARLGPGTPFDSAVQASMEHRFGRSFDDVRLHVDSAGQKEASRQHARAFTVGTHVGFAPGNYRPGTLLGDALIAHELAHVVQQSQPGKVDHDTAERDADQAVAEAASNQAAPEVRSGLALQRCADTPIPEPVEPKLNGRAEPGQLIEQYQQSGKTFHPGDAAGPNVLTRMIRHDNAAITFEWYNFSGNGYVHGGVGEWLSQVYQHAYDGDTFAQLGKQLTAKQWGELGDDPGARLLQMHDKREINMPDSAVLKTYEGMIYAEAVKTLNRNETKLDETLNAPDRVGHLKEFAEGLREAGIIRDELEARRAQLAHSLTQAKAPGLGYAGRFDNLDPARRLAGTQELNQVEDAIAFWRAAFPLLTRLKTSEINANRILAVLFEVKANIAATRKDLELARNQKGSLELFQLTPVRASLQHQLGERTARTVAAEDKRRGTESLVTTGLLVAGSIALLFIPGGVIVDAAIGIALAAKSIDEAITLGHAANTGEDVDAGLVQQSQADWAAFGAKLSVIGAVVSTASAAFRVLKFARGMRAVAAAAPGISVEGRARVARLLARHPELVATPRSTAGLRQSLADLKLSATAEELTALRNLSFGGKRLGTSADALDAFLDRVWQDRARILASAKPNREVYRLYSMALEENKLVAKTADQYLKDIARIAQARPPGALSNTQILSTGRTPGNQISGLLSDQANRATLVEREFFRFERAGVTLADLIKGVDERIYINAVADHATEVMKFVVSDIVDQADRFPGVLMAKLSASGAAARRSDTIVVYLKSAADSERVLTRLASYQKAHPEHFMNSTPAMTEQMARGVSVASEPTNAVLRDLSFGTSRANPIADALSKATSREDFGSQTRALLKAEGIDLEFPHLNAPPTPTSGGSLPPPTPSPGNVAGPVITGSGKAASDEGSK